LKKKLSVKSLIKELRIEPGSRAKLRDKDADNVFGWTKEEGEKVFAETREELTRLQYKLYADGRYPVLIVLQATDGAGKDSTIQHVMTAFNPQGCIVTSFKAPTSDELKHDFLWRIHRHVPARGEIGAFNRSHYEDVLIVRVDNLVPEDIWRKRYEQINDFERMLSESGTRIIKFFLQISKDEQLRRFQDRLDDPTKQWKFNPDDIAKRKEWDQYQAAYEDALTQCSTRWAPWHVIPADKKWFRNLAVAQILAHELGKLPLRFPEATFDPAKIRLR
jgi:PPK2 family polyphosphate:nucleotide phosphotransferase